MLSLHTLTVSMFSGRQFLDYRGNHAAGTAPCRPKIDQVPAGGLEYFGLEILILNLNGIMHVNCSFFRFFINQTIIEPRIDRQSTGNISFSAEAGK